MNFLCWNIRGIGKGEKTLSVKKIVGEKKISFMGLVETKHKRPARSRMKRMWGYDGFDICEVLASETNGGGLIATWDKSTFEVANRFTGDRWILLEGSLLSHMFECCVGVIYGQNDRVERCALLQEIKCRVVSINKPCLLMGDFNTVLHPTERSGTFSCVQSMREFSEWISELNLIDIPLHGVRFTWRRNESKSRLDRALCCQAWLTKFPNLNLIGLKRTISDHNPLLLSLEAGNNWGPKPF